MVISGYVCYMYILFTTKPHLYLKFLGVAQLTLLGNWELEKAHTISYYNIIEP